MKSKTLAITLLGCTAAAVALFPTLKGIAMPQPVEPIPIALPQPGDSRQRPVVEAVFVLDTTGSMSGLIQAAKEKIWSIASTMAAAQPTPDIRIGLVAYRDRGDSYVTQMVDLSSDLDSVYATLMDFRADGGGDGPESVNQALHDAVHKIGWSQQEQAYKVVFLVGDAPPHMDYPDEVKYPLTIAEAGKRGIVVNTIQAGRNPATAQQWQRMAQLSQGSYFQVGQEGNAVAIATPFDDKLAKLSADLDDTRLFYGSAEEKAEKQRKQAASEKVHREASISSRARRAAFNASKAGEKNLLGGKELVDDVSSGRLKLDEIDEAELPAPLQAVDKDQRQAVIEQTAQRRDELKQEMQQLAEQRKAYLKKKVEESEGVEESLDHKLYGVIREQAASSGLVYEAEAPSY